MQNNHIEYKTWRDRGENIGVQCMVCFRTHWTGKEEATDPTTGNPCANCQAIKDGKLLQIENDEHRKEIANYKSDVEVGRSRGVNPETLHFSCNHPLSQSV